MIEKDTIFKQNLILKIEHNSFFISIIRMTFCNDHDALHQIITSFPIVAHTLVNMYCQRILDNNCHTPQGCLASSNCVCYLT